MNKKRLPPRHIQKHSGVTPQPDLKLIQTLDTITDPRGASCNFIHPLITILFITIVGSLCGADDWEAIVLQTHSMKEWLNQFVDMTNGVPCIRTFKRVFSILDPSEFEKIQQTLSDFIKEKKSGEIVSFDGKTMRGTSCSEKGLKAIHMLNAWSHDNGICIGHMKVADKSNEIKALPKLMELLDLKGSIITADALNTQKAIAKKTINMGADYVLPVKRNHPNLFEEIKALFENADTKNYSDFDSDAYETMEKSHGRIELRKYYSLDATKLPSAKEWEGLLSVGIVIRTRTEKGKTSREMEYYVSSCKVDAHLLAKVVRGHWGIENSLDWVLDVSFREDKLRYRDRIGVQNLASIRKLVLGALTKHKILKSYIPRPTVKKI